MCKCKKNIGGETGFSETLEFPMQRDLGITEAMRLELLKQ